MTGGRKPLNGVMENAERNDNRDACGVPRQRLFEPGKYSSLPNVILADPGLPASAKLVWMALVRHLQDDAVSVWPSMARLASLTGISRDTAIQSVARLEAAGLVVIERVFGQPSTYRILQPDAGFAAAHQSENPTGRKTLPVGKTNRTGRENQPVPVGKPDTKYSRKYSKNNSPPTPRVAGGVLASDSLADADRKAAEKLSSARMQRSSTAEAAVERIDAAWQSVVGIPLGSKYRRRITRGWPRGDRPWLERIDAAAVEGGLAMAERAKGTFGLDWVRKHLEAVATTGVKRTAAKRSQGKAAEEAALVANMAAEEAASRADDARRRAEWFASLSASQQEAWRRKVREGRFAPKRTDVLEAQAALAAWQDGHRETER